jgi:hypothetical protein
MSSADVVSYLIEKQAEEGIPAHVMAQRIGTTETNWSHARRGRRGLTVAQIERAIQHYPEIAERFARPSQAVAS